MRAYGLRLTGALALLLAVGLMIPGCPRTGIIPGDFLSAGGFGPGRGGEFVNTPGAPTDDGEAEGDGGGERGVVEPDVIRQAGDTLFVLNQHRGLSIVDLATEELLSQTPTMGLPRDLYVIGDRAYVLVAYTGGIVYAEDAVSSSGTVNSRLYVVDVSNLDAPAILGEFGLEGDLIDSRLVGDVLYAVSARYSYYYGVEEESVVKQQTSASWVTSVDVSNPANVRVADTLSFDGIGNVIQATSSAIFVSGHDWQTDASNITYVDISDPAGAIAVRGTVSVPGNVADRFKMDVWNGVLRVVSNTGWQNRQTYVSTVSLANPDALAVLGQTTIPGAENETLFATRFDGPRAYAVTYLVIDPLFVLDLSDPANPVVAGELKVPGWSTHIEPRGDRLVALGVDDTEGRRVSVSLFDVSDPAAPALLDRESFGQDWSWSTAYEDVKAFTVLDDTLIVPFSGWTEAGGFDRLQFLNYDDTSLTLRGHVDLRGQAVRSFEHANHFYGVTQEQIAIIDGANLDAPEVIKTITLAENLADFLPLNAPEAEGVAVIRSYTNNTVLLRAEAPDGSTLSTLEFSGDYVHSVSGNGKAVALVSTVWENESSYTVVQTVDYANPAAPVLNDAVKLDIRPNYSWWWYDGGPGGGPGGVPVDVEPVAGRMIAPYPYYGEPSSVIAEDYLVVHGELASAPYGDAAKVIAAVNLLTGQVSSLVTLDYGWVNGVIAAGNSVVIHSQEDAGQNLFGQVFTRHYASLFNPATLEVGPRANVPGRPVAYEGTLLTLEDWQYTTGYNVNRLLATARWDGGSAAQLLDTQTLSNSYGDLLASGGYVYTPRWANGFFVDAFAIGGNGNIDARDPLALNTWGNLLAADGGTLYLLLNGNVLRQYDNPGNWDLRTETGVSGWPSAVRFAGDTAYLPLGYGGLLTLER